MSGPLPGPMRPPTDHPKFNVLVYYAMGALVGAFSVATLAHGYWRLLAVLFVALGLWLSVAAIRAGTAAEKRDDEDFRK